MMVNTTPTQFWNDNCSLKDLAFAIEHGASGATTNPLIVSQVLEAELDQYDEFIRKLIRDNSMATEDDIAWMVNKRMAVDGAKLLEPVFEASGGAAGYISIQTNAKHYRDTQKIVDQAVDFKTLAKNIMIKMPVTFAGVKAIEECIFRGVNINATVSYTVSQALAVAQAVERGLARREDEGLSSSELHPICTIMVGRVDDWFRKVMTKQGIIVDPIAIDFAGVAVFKRAYQIYKEKNYKTRLLVAAFRNHYHWSEFIGGDVSMTIPPAWIKQFVNCDITVENRMQNPVDPGLIAQLGKHFPDWEKTYEPDGMKLEEFVSYGATRDTLMQFLEGYDSFIAIIRDIMVNG